MHRAVETGGQASVDNAAGFPQHRPMILARFLFLAVLLAAPAVAAQPADTAFAREVTAEVNGGLARMQRVAFRAQRPDVDYESQVRAWRDDHGLRKIEVTDLDDSGSVVTEYYFRDAGLVFAYVAIKGWKGEREVTRIERRQYFRGDAMVRWLDGMDKVERTADDPEYPAEATLRLDAARFYLDASTTAFQDARTP
jgi:hypothetical protein